MSLPPPLPAAAEALLAHDHLATTDPRFAALIETVGPPDLREPRSSAFEALARSIVFQQLAGAAATTIWNRFRALVKGRLTPDEVLLLGDDELRGAGLSGSKAAAIRDLAMKSVDGSVPLRNLWRLSDDEVVERLVVVRGIGPWTAQMFLMFQLRRPDVWPVGDLGVRKGYQLVFELPEMPTPDELAEHGEPFKPYRSAAAWYMWRAVDTVIP
jgi:3-methyladenine DNA glycosylase/8-oxoguanine DNA glycosylase